MKKSEFPTAQEYASEKAQHPKATVVDIRSEQAHITDSYGNHVLFDVNDQCMRLAVFETEYRWHYHPKSDELFLVVAGELQIDFENGNCATLTEWQAIVVPAGVVHRTRAVGRMVNVTYKKQGAETVFAEPPSDGYAGSLPSTPAT